MPVNDTVFFWLGLITEIFFVWTIALPPPSFFRVIVTTMLTSCASPESSTVTANARFGVAVIVFSLPVESVWLPGCALVPTMFVPCRPETWPPVDAPRSRLSIRFSDVSANSCRFATNVESGGTTPFTPSFDITVFDGTWKRSDQTTSLASSRSDCASRSAASPVVFFGASSSIVFASPSTPLIRSCSASISCSFSGRSGPGGSRLCACFTFWRSWSAIPRSVAEIDAAFEALVSAFATAAPSSCDPRAIFATSFM